MEKEIKELYVEGVAIHDDPNHAWVLRTPDVMKGRGLRSSWVPGGCWGVTSNTDVGGPYV